MKANSSVAVGPARATLASLGTSVKGNIIVAVVIVIITPVSRWGAEV